jgi:haloalkane dehalogenase
MQDRYVTLSPGRLHYLDEGQGEPVLLVHGTPTFSYEWRHVIARLSPRFRCVAPDLMGFGQSDRPRGFPYTPEAHAAALAEFVRALDLPRFTLVAHDFGGPIGLPLCLDNPDQVSRLVIINTWMWSFDDDPGMRRAGRIAGGRVGRFLYRWLNLELRLIMPSAYGDKRKLTTEIHRVYLDRFPDRWSRGAVLWPLAQAILGSSAFYESLWTKRARLRGRPALIVWGMRDSVFRPHMLERWKTVLPEARVVAIDNAGHWPHEEEPELVAGAIADFLMIGSGAT